MPRFTLAQRFGLTFVAKVVSLTIVLFALALHSGKEPPLQKPQPTSSSIVSACEVFKQKPANKIVQVLQKEIDFSYGVALYLQPDPARELFAKQMKKLDMEKQLEQNAKMAQLAANTVGLETQTRYHLLAHRKALLALRKGVQESEGAAGLARKTAQLARTTTTLRVLCRNV